MTCGQSPAGHCGAGCESTKQRFRVVTRLPGRLTVCPTLRHQEQISKNKKRGEEMAAAFHTAFAAVWWALEIIRVFGYGEHSLQDTHCSRRAPQSCPNGPCLPGFLRPPHPGAGAPLGDSPWFSQRLRPQGPPQARSSSFSRPSPGPGCQVGKEDLGGRCLDQKGTQCG